MAEILFPYNRTHQRLFHAIFVELKWVEGGFLPTLEPIACKLGISVRVLETVRAKMRRLGIVDHVSKFNKNYGYREGWILSKRFSRALRGLADKMDVMESNADPGDEKRDRGLLRLNGG